MASMALSRDMLTMVADRFKALSEPARLQLLQCLLAGEMSVNELVDTTGLGQANISKHLRVLHALGFVTRRKDGLFVYYTLADHNVFKLCDVMCNRVKAQLEQQQRHLDRPSDRSSAPSTKAGRRSSSTP